MESNNNTFVLIMAGGVGSRFLDRYPTSSDISIDYAILEKADNIYTLPADIGWSDLGTWASLHAIAEQDEQQNVYNLGHIHLK